jgi:hypothetical protein
MLTGIESTNQISRTTNHLMGCGFSRRRNVRLHPIGGIASQALIIFAERPARYPVTDRNVQKSLASRAVTRYS